METATVTVAADGDETTLDVGGTCAVGRSRTADLVVDHDRVSRRHLVIEPSGDGWSARDVSANGTWLDGSRITVVRVEGSQRFRLGAPTGPEVVVTTAPVEPATVTGAGDEPATSLAGIAPPAAAAAAARNRQVADPARPYTRPDTPVADAGTPAAAPKRRRGRRRLGIAVLVLLVLLLVADRVGAKVAGNEMVKRIQSSEQLPSKPSVSVGGFPFLTQVAFGKYTDLGVTIRGLTTPGPRIDHLTAHLRGVHVELGDALANKVGKVPVDHVVGSVFLSFTDLNAFLAKQPGEPKLSSSNGELEVGTGLIGGITVPVPLPTSQLSVSGDSIKLLGGAINDLADVDIPLGQLPFELQLDRIRIHSTDIEITAKADSLVLDAS